MATTMAVYRAPADYADSAHPLVATRAGELCAGARGRRDAARAIFAFVRDLRYEGGDFEDLEIYRASSVLAAGHGYCVGKAALCTALARAAGIPARLAFADVRNHLASPRLLAAMGTDTFAWHGYSQLFLGGRWVSVSPTFDPGTCRRAGVPPLEFDGEHDALLQSFDPAGATMRYLRRHGTFHDVPAQFLAAEMPRLYPFARDHGISRFLAGQA
ncbi:MAG: transglutaminase domain-containing protein [Streptosporangiaceae bacterium]|nr:transglutaminase domain-containing protein [Streptosporangiaceae bacterium]